MREETTHDRWLVRMRAQFWDSLPTRAYRVRQLIRKQRQEDLGVGELEELELTVNRIADSARSLGFSEVAEVGSALATSLWRQRAGRDECDAIDDQCDQLDQIIDDMTLEALAVGLRSLWLE